MTSPRPRSRRPRPSAPATPSRRPPASGPLLPRLLLLVERLARDLPPSGVEELHVERVGAVVVGSDQREAVLDQDALVDRELGELGRGDHSRSPEGTAVDERDLGAASLL